VQQLLLEQRLLLARQALWRFELPQGLLRTQLLCRPRLLLRKELLC